MKRHILPILLIATISIALYANTLKNGFVYDDEYTIVNNALIKDLHNLPILVQNYYFAFSGEESYRPVVTFTYFMDYALFGVNPWGYHLTNSLLHALNGILCYIFLALLLRPSNNRYTISATLLDNLPLSISLLFLTNPVLTEAVNAISFREDLLVFFFNMATLNLYIVLNAIRRHSLRLPLYALSCLLYLLSLLSKEMAASLPLIIYSYEWTKTDRKKGLISSAFNPYNIGYVAITLTYIYLRFRHFDNHIAVLINAKNPSWSLTERLATLPWLLLNYMKLSVFPISLSAEYVIEQVKSFSSISFIGPFFILTILVAIAYFMGKKDKLIAFGILFFLLSLIPVYNIFPITNPIAERYLYFPAVGLILFVALSIRLVSQGSHGRFQAAYIVILSTILCIYSLDVVKRNEAWIDNYTLWSDTVKKMPNSSRAHDNLGLIFANKGQLDKAILHYQSAVKLKPESSKAHNNLGIAYAGKKQFAYAIKEFEAALKIEPNNPNFHSNIGMAYEKTGRFTEAIDAYKTALKLNPVNPEFFFNIGRVYVELGRFDEGIREYKHALELKPDYSDAKIYLEIAYNELQQKNRTVQEKKPK